MGLYPPIVSSNPPVLTRRYDTVEFFVDGSNGSDDGSRPGDRPEKPLLTIKEAVSRCVSGEQNVINVIAPGHVAEVNPIVIDKQFVTIRGWPSQAPGGQSPCTLVATVDAAYFTIAAQDVCIRDFTIHGGASHPTINYSPVAWSFRTVIHNITFKAGTWGIAQGSLTAVGFVADAPSHGWAITECKFLPGLSVGGIMLASNGSWGLVADCFFEYMPEWGVYGHLNCQSAGVQVLRNRFMNLSDVVGNAIYIGTQATRWHVAGNQANDNDGAVQTNQPYFDQANASAWYANVETHAGFTEAPPD